MRALLYLRIQHGHFWSYGAAQPEAKHAPVRDLVLSDRSCAPP